MYYDTPDDRPAVSIQDILEGGAVPIDVGFLAGDVTLYGRACILRGWSLGESAGTPAQCNIELYDHAKSNLGFVARINMPASTSSMAWFSGNGVQMMRGLRAHTVTGLCVGTVFILPLQ